MLIALALAASTAGAGPASAAETALRCGVLDAAPILARNAPTIRAVVSGGPSPAPVMLPLPAMMVVGWSVDRMPVGDALSELARGAGFSVEADAGLSPVSWKGEDAPLSVVIARLARASGGVPSFDGRTLRISRPAPVAPWRISAPEGRDAALAVLDALRGYGATDVLLEKDQVSFHATDPVVSRIRKGLSSVSGVVAFDVWTYRVQGSPDWSRLGEMSTVSEAHPSISGGRFVTGYIPSTVFTAFLSTYGSTVDMGAQTVAGPLGWAMEAPLGQCASVAADVGSMTLRPTWNGTTMSVEVSGPRLGAGRLGSLSPGSVAIVAGVSDGGWSAVSLIRPRVLSSR